MTTFADYMNRPFRVEVLCDNCILNGPRNPDCTCTDFEPPEPPPAAATRLPEPEPTPFARDVMEKDRIAEMDNTHGVECRRWSTCAWSDCQVVSPEMRTWWEQRRWEDDHACFGCQHKAPPVDWIDENLRIWPYPQPHPFNRDYKPLENTIHITRRQSHAYTPSWVPAVRRAAA